MGTDGAPFVRPPTAASGGVNPLLSFVSRNTHIPPQSTLNKNKNKQTTEAGPTRASIKTAPGRQGKQQRLQASKALR
jgi:hypothetical protein